MEYLLDRIRELISALLESSQVDIVDLKMQRENGRVFLRFFVDKPQGGITLQECADLNTEIGKILDDSGIIQESFVLEVSSPGIDRPLSTEKDFKRAINRNLKIFLAEAIEGRLEFDAKLVSVADGVITILWQDKEVAIPMDKINKAKQIIQQR